MNKIDADVLIIGAGAAGIRAALAASEAGVDVLMVAKGAVTESGSTFSPIAKGWGMQALVGNERTEQNLESFYNEVIRVGLEQCDSKLVRILVEESGPRFEDLLSYGIRFKRDAQGSFLRVRGCFSDIAQAFVTEDLKNLKQTFSARINASTVNIVQGQAVDLFTIDNTCWGAWFLKEDENILQINAKATVLATGGGAGIFSEHLTTGQETGDGYAMARRAGARFKNLEFIQFMMGMKENETRQFLPLGDLHIPRIILDENGLDILKTHISNAETRLRAVRQRQSHFPFSCRDDSHFVDIAVAHEQKAGNKVYWKPVEKKKAVEVVHYAHAFNGGLEINDKAETTVPGLFAAGEVAAGPHGADRIGGCMMTATQVFGERAGRFAARHAKSIDTCPNTKKISHMIKEIDGQTTYKRKGKKLSALKKELRNTFSRSMMILRQKDGLDICLQKIKEADSLLDTIKEGTRSDFLNFKNMLLTMKLIATSALNREESLGSHYRTGSLPSISDPPD